MLGEGEEWGEALWMMKSFVGPKNPEKQIKRKRDKIEIFMKRNAKLICFAVASWYDLNMSLLSIQCYISYFKEQT